MVLFSVGLILDALIAHEHVAPWHWMVLATSLIGALLMFINPAYMNAAENTDGYKKISFSFTYLVQKNLQCHDSQHVYELCVVTATCCIYLGCPFSGQEGHQII
ncbi:hypothetical protein [Lacticaseibacillus camelliae]|uniref:hypothetical protein n=1 Tax=Lacticaseibacillus camelliae TaxID=381742 RepID=UPI003F729D0A